MQSFLIFRMIMCILSIFVSTVDGDSDLYSDERLFPDPGSPFLYNSQDVSGSLFEDTDSNNALATISGSGDGSIPSPLSSFDDDNTDFGDTSFGPLADCSVPVTSPTMGKSRVRQLDTSEACKDPAKIITVPSLPDSGRPTDVTGITNLQSTFLDPGTGRILNTDDPNLNLNCHLTTLGILPWGVCPSPHQQDKHASDEEPLPSAWGVFELWHLDHCTLGMCEIGRG